jgi:hypothetical protein
MHEIAITLLDDTGLSRNYTQRVNFVLEATQDQYYTIEIPTDTAEVYDVEFGPTEEPEFKVMAMITEVDEFAQLTIEFNTRMSTKYLNMTHINETIADIYVMPSNNWHLYEDDGEYAVDPNLNLTWVVHSYGNKTMKVNLSFLNPP